MENERYGLRGFCGFGIALNVYRRVRRPRCTVCKFIGNIYLVGEHSVLPRYG